MEDKTYGIKTHLVEEFKQFQISKYKTMAFVGNCNLIINASAMTTNVVASNSVITINPFPLLPGGLTGYQLPPQRLEIIGIVMIVLMLHPALKITLLFGSADEAMDFVGKLNLDGRLPPGKGKILHSFMMGTHSTLSPKENVALMQFMEDEVLRMATERRFEGIFTTNTSPLTQQLGTDVYHYQTLLDYQVNEYVAADGTRPFKMAPDSQRALVQWKPIVIQNGNCS